MIAAVAGDAAAWEAAARDLLARGVPPDQVAWREAGDAQTTLADLLAPAPDAVPTRVAGAEPSALTARARIVACHRDPRRWALLYRILWRLHHGEPRLLDDPSDPDTIDLQRREHQVARDAYRMQAYVRFRRVADGGDERWLAWYRPDHRVLALAAPFFVRRFGGMRWAIVTPDESASWDGERLRLGPGGPHDGLPDADAAEDLWRTYYRSVFNPARLKVAAMLAQLPMRIWPTLPEAQEIPGLIADAAERVARMRADPPPSAIDHLPAQRDLASLRAALPACRGCDLCAHATRAIAGEGPADARIMLVGEQPGDVEDRAGRAFVGPAGQVLDRALAEAGLDRQRLYVTNAVKHFRYALDPFGRRQHKTPSAKHAAACRPWLEAELAALRPALVVALGATAAASLLGRRVAVQAERGVIRPGPHGGDLLVTAHPAAILRLGDPGRAADAYAALVADLRLAALHTA